MPRESKANRIRREAEEICNPHNIEIVLVFRLPREAGGGYAVTLSLPPGFASGDIPLEVIRNKLEFIDGVTRVFVELAKKE